MISGGVRKFWAQAHQTPHALCPVPGAITIWPHAGSCEPFSLIAVETNGASVRRTSSQRRLRPFLRATAGAVDRSARSVACPGRGARDDPDFESFVNLNEPAGSRQQGNPASCAPPTAVNTGSRARAGSITSGASVRHRRSPIGARITGIDSNRPSDRSSSRLRTRQPAREALPRTAWPGGLRASSR